MDVYVVEVFREDGEFVASIATSDNIAAWNFWASQPTTYRRVIRVIDSEGRIVA